MSKELETIKYLLEQCVNENIKKDLLDIETALKEYELMKQTKLIIVDKEISDEDLEKLKNQRVFVGGLEQCEIKPLFDEETQKKLKAFEIIKEKKVAVNYLYYRAKFNAEKYNDNYIETLTQEECDLLKEVLL